MCSDCPIPRRFSLKLHRQDISDDELLEDIKRVAREVEQTWLTQRQYEEQSTFSSNTIVKRFRGWNPALRKAGLSVRNTRNPSREELFQTILLAWETLGRQPTYTEMTGTRFGWSSSAIARVFGAWNSGLVAFAEYMNSQDLESESGTTHSMSEVPTSKLPRRTKRAVGLRMRFRVLQRDQFRCRRCGRSPATEPGVVRLHVDHDEAWSKGGDTVESNLVTLCEHCNLGKGDMDSSTKQ